MDDVVVEEECIIGALSFVKAGTRIERRSLVVGNPAKKVKDVSDDMIAWKTKGTALYQALPGDCHESLKSVDALTEIPDDRPSQESLYDRWNKITGEK